jgi:hypothetical protein
MIVIGYLLDIGDILFHSPEVSDKTPRMCVRSKQDTVHDPTYERGVCS